MTEDTWPRGPYDPCQCGCPRLTHNADDTCACGCWEFRKAGPPQTAREP